MILSPKDERMLKGVHPDLVKVVRESARLIDKEGIGFVLTCGVRTRAEQAILVKKGASQTMNSRHIPGADGFSKAVDYAVTLDGKVRWDWPLYHKLARVVKNAAIAVNVPIEWGGDWKSFKDGPHFQLPHKRYP